MVAQRYRDPDVAVHYLVERDARLHEAVAQIHRVADVCGQLRSLGGRGDHVWTLKLRQLRMERQADECQQHGDDGNGFFHDFGFWGYICMDNLPLARYELF